MSSDLTSSFLNITWEAAPLAVWFCNIDLRIDSGISSYRFLFNCLKNSISHLTCCNKSFYSNCLEWNLFSGLCIRIVTNMKPQIGFSMYNIVLSKNSDRFNSSFPMWMAFISLSIALVRTANTMLNESGKSGHSGLAPNIRGKSLSFDHWIWF